MLFPGNDAGISVFPPLWPSPKSLLCFELANHRPITEVTRVSWQPDLVAEASNLGTASGIPQ